MTASLIPSHEEIRARYRVRLLESPRLTAAGVEHLQGGARVLLEWSRVELATAAEIGEPEGVRTVVFDLVAAREGGAHVAWRLDAEPGEDAVEIARRIEVALDPARLGASIKSLGGDGVASQWFPDLEAFEAAMVSKLAG